MPTFRAPAKPPPPAHLTPEYFAYLDSPEWREKREGILERNGWACEWCMEVNATQIHHLTYRRFGRESSLDLLALCADCHRKADDARHRFTDWAIRAYGRHWHYRGAVNLWWYYLEWAAGPDGTGRP